MKGESGGLSRFTTEHCSYSYGCANGTSLHTFDTRLTIHRPPAHTPACPHDGRPAHAHIRHLTRQSVRPPAGSAFYRSVPPKIYNCDVDIQLAHSRTSTHRTAHSALHLILFL